MVIRDYKDSDERGWLICRVVSFLDCSYFDDVKKEKERYEDAVCLVAEDGGRIIGLIDVEIETGKGTICSAAQDTGSVVWHLAVLPEYRHQGVAEGLWHMAKERLLSRGVTHCEAWTQGDEAANRWYQKQGFHMMPEKSWLRCYAYGDTKDEGRTYINHKNIGDIYGVEQLVFEAPPGRLGELMET